MQLKKTLATAIIIVTATSTSAADKTSQTERNPDALFMAMKAYMSRASWGDQFPGFEAKLAVNINGERSEGTERISGVGAVDIDLTDEAARKWAKEQLTSIVNHRFADGEAADHSQYEISFADDETDHPLGRLIEVKGASIPSSFRIKGSVITEVHRKIGGQRFTISVTDVAENAEGKLLPKAYSVSYWDGDTDRLLITEDYQERWVRVGTYDLPARRLMVRSDDDGRRVYELELSEHRLLRPEGQAEAETIDPKLSALLAGELQKQWRIESSVLNGKQQPGTSVVSTLKSDGTWIDTNGLSGKWKLAHGGEQIVYDYTRYGLSVRCEIMELTPQKLVIRFRDMAPGLVMTMAALE